MSTWWCHFSHVLLFETLWTVACQALLSMGFSSQEYWSGLQFFPPGDLPDPRFIPMPPMSPALAGSLPLAPPGKSNIYSLQEVYFSQFYRN